jgi:hypothetical protein
MVAILILPFLLDLEADVCETALLVWNKKKHEKTIITNIHFIGFWFSIDFSISILRVSQ